MLTYAMTALAADKQARLAGASARPSAGSTSHPTATNAVPSRVTAWLDARCESDAELADLVAAIEKQGGSGPPRRHRARGHGRVGDPGEVAFDAALIERLQVWRPGCR